MIEHRDLNYWRIEILKYDSKLNAFFDNCKNRTEQSVLILDGIRNFTEAVICYIAEANEPKEFDKRYSEIERGKKYCKSIDKFNFLNKFLDNLNASIGHETIDDDYAERLSIKYVNYLIRIKKILNHEFGLNVLNSIIKFPFDLDDSFEKYYKEIANAVVIDSKNFHQDLDNYYIQKKKPIYVKNILFYEYVLTHAMDSNNKSDRLIVFSLLDINTKYAIRAKLISKPVNIFNKKIEYEFLVDYSIAIRPCEIEKLAKIVKISDRFTSKNNDYYKLMEYLKEYDVNFVDVVKLKKHDFNEFIDKIFDKKTILKDTIEKCYEIINSNITGKNTLLYLIYKLNNNILKYQLPWKIENGLKDIYLDKGVYSFEKSPFSSSLIRHNPSLSDLIEVFDYSEHIPEIISRKIEKLSNESACIYIPKEDLKMNCDLNVYIKKYNLQFAFKHQERQIKEIGNFVYLNENELETIELLNILKNKSNEISFKLYNAYAKAKITQYNIKFDDKDKEIALINAFLKGSLYAVYGSAGTGKSYFARYLLKVMDNCKKVCIANTNSAVDNMKIKFIDNSANYLTVRKYLQEYKFKEVELLIVDECSTISTKNMLKILTTTNPKLVLLLGDVFQIESITFGNWFALLRESLNNDKYIELKNQFRSQNNILLHFWNEVRNIGSSIQELLAINQISHDLTDDIFEKKYNDEIVLCLNYDGLYGINNINKVLQNNNPNFEIKWKQFKYKIGDPILFCESTKYKQIFYNNLKGIILNIDQNDSQFMFKIKVYAILNSLQCDECGVELISIADNYSIIVMTINKYKENSNDEDKEFADFIPFQIAYAISIHKAQGLEYDSVKIIISNEIEENITHNIFYTAITRARHQLNIYWSKETENKVVDAFKKKNYNRDYSILQQKIKS